MTDSFPVSCIINRYWDTADKKFIGDRAEGKLIEFTTGSADNDNGKIIPVGIVVLDANVDLEIAAGTLQSVPVEFITIL